MSQPGSERDRFVAFAFASADALIETDVAGHITFAAGALARFTGSDAALDGRPLPQLLSRADRALLRLLLDEIDQGGRRGPVRVRSCDGNAAAACSLLRTVPGGAVHVALRHVPAPQTTRDESGLMAPGDFVELVEKEFLRALETDRRFELSLVRLVGIDAVEGGIDGPHVEAFLAKLAASLRAVSVDGAGAARLGPTQFAVVREAEGDAGRLDRLVQEALTADAPGGVTIERRDLDGDDPSLSPAQACAALRHAVTVFRRDGHVRFDHLADALRQKLSETAARVEAAKAVIDSRAFHVVYQPIVGLTDGRVHHNEALSRLTRAGQKIFDFVTFAEEIGFIVDFDFAVCREVLNTLSHLRRKRRRPHVAVNLSARSLQSDGFVDRLLDLCGTMAEPGQLLFEVTESFQLVDLGRADRVIQALRGRGHAVCLDDFGAGAAAFHYIQSLEVDYVKLDGSFVKRVAESERDAAVVRGMVALCRSVGVAIIAEMVETDAVATAMRELGVQYAQGFLYGTARNEPADASGARLRFAGQGGNVLAGRG